MISKSTTTNDCVLNGFFIQSKHYLSSHVISVVVARQRCLHKSGGQMILTLTVPVWCAVGEKLFPLKPVVLTTIAADHLVTVAISSRFTDPSREPFQKNDS
ncbi:hypothetical protein AMECASPLE_012261 [Ameca splendens]|uniref:Uncharacterized protein n=1 Tax=Ameca splendens TaxID=208324 RepID=A0ABV0ZKR6_9TELE